MDSGSSLRYGRNDDFSISRDDFPFPSERRFGMTETSIANTAQHEYWNTVAGPRWVGLDGFVERRIGAVNELLLGRSRVRSGENVIEIGCGTGAATVPFAEAVGPEGRVVGVDLSLPMLAA